ncbi:hypothetical protein [Novosphingobium aromaticivorans]|uniref:hypothetical protein n=1 Tax=Novosphingobium aromaticivorans TaxID=48935 RepID=UPI00115FEB2A|nr:hypothetical protein [Novosphingobium aromaticivorans]
MAESEPTPAWLATASRLIFNRAKQCRRAPDMENQPADFDFEGVNPECDLPTWQALPLLNNTHLLPSASKNWRGT